MIRKKTTRASALERLVQLSRSLERFYPECARQFMCPTCLSVIDIGQDKRVSVAHVIPKAAGGRLTTLLCKPCNSHFGTRQDRWLGEHLQIAKEKRTPLDTQERHLILDRIRVSGNYQSSPDRGLDFVIWNQTTSTAARTALDTVDGRRLEISIPMPVPIANRDLVSVGFLTAAYLLWFRELGYSWALQEHLELVRQQILRPDETILSRAFTAPTCEVFDRPWVGTGRLAGKVVLVAGIADTLVFLPPPGSTDFYDSLPPDYSKVDLNTLKALRFHLPDGLAAGPVSVAFEDQVIVAPDVCFDASRDDIPHISLPPDALDLQVLHPTTIAVSEHLAQWPHGRRVQAEAGARPRSETGRPARAGMASQALVRPLQSPTTPRRTHLG